VILCIAYFKLKNLGRVVQTTIYNSMIAFAFT